MLFFFHLKYTKNHAQLKEKGNRMIKYNFVQMYRVYARLVIGTSRTVGSAKKFVRITSGFGGGEFTKTLRKVCACQKLKLSFLLLEYCKIRDLSRLQFTSDESEFIPDYI